MRKISLQNLLFNFLGEKTSIKIKYPGKSLGKVILTIFLLVFVTANSSFTQQKPSLTLKQAFKGDFLMGAAMNMFQFTGRDTLGAEIVKEQFNSISPENVLKWERVHPEPGKYNFGPSDKYVEFGMNNNMFIIGHNLVWHHQTPRWVFEDKDGKPLDRAELLKRMHDHIQTVVGRYKGKIKGWDVVNEALNDNGTLRHSEWFKIIGPDFIEKAFQYAHEADPQAELYYNDYSMGNKLKREGAIKIYKDLRAKGIPITAIGAQMHLKLGLFDSLNIDSMFADFKNNGIKVMVTELDIDVLPMPSRNMGANVGLNFQRTSKLNPYKNALPDSVNQKLADAYQTLFKIFLKYKDEIKRVTFWGVRNGDSWLNNWPVFGRTNYPLLFNRNGKPNLSFYKVIKDAAANK